MAAPAPRDLRPASAAAAAAPIPPLAEPPDWARLPIVECAEPLVPLVPGEGGLWLRPQYALLGIPGAPDTISVRSGVRERLFQAADALRARGLGLLVFDASALAVQRFLYDGYEAQVRAAHPGWTTRRSGGVSTSSSPRRARTRALPPPHRTGGAVDVCLVDGTTGRPLPMGTEPDETSPASHTRHFEEHPREPFTTHRRLLFHAMTGAGVFTNYLGEWWHYDFGNTLGELRRRAPRHLRHRAAKAGAGRGLTGVHPAKGCAARSTTARLRKAVFHGNAGRDQRYGTSASPYGASAARGPGGPRSGVPSSAPRLSRNTGSRGAARSGARAGPWCVAPTFRYKSPPGPARISAFTRSPFALVWGIRWTQYVCLVPHNGSPEAHVVGPTTGLISSPGRIAAGSVT
jgi:D-alanyl-D-alanine dipeptidase